VIFEGTNAPAVVLVHRQEYNEELGGEALEAAREMQVVAEVAQPRRVFDLNGEAPVSTSNAISVSLGEASAAALSPQLFISARREGVVVRLGCSKPRMPSRNPSANIGTTYSGPVPDHLAAGIHEWLRGRGVLHCNGGFVTPQAKKLTIIQEARRSHGTEFSNQQRTQTLQTARGTPRASPSIEAIRGPLLFGNLTNCSQ
jgi:hypothetical protein